MMKEDLTVNEVNSMLNKHSGLLAISGVSSDMREITDGMEAGEPNSTLAFEMYTYRMRKYIGSYAAAMDGVDAIVFTAGVGENSVVIRQHVCEKLTFLGVEIDREPEQGAFEGTAPYLDAEFEGGRIRHSDQ